MASSTSSNINYRAFFTRTEVSLCGCYRPTRLMVSQTERNPGRRFWGCSHTNGMHCDYFRWHDAWVNERTLLVLNELRRLNSNLERPETDVASDRLSELERENGLLTTKLENARAAIEKMKVIKRAKEGKLKGKLNFYMVGFYGAVGVLIYKLCSE